MELLNLLLGVLLIFLGAQHCDLSRFVYKARMITISEHFFDVCAGVAVSAFGLFKLISCLVN